LRRPLDERFCEGFLTWRAHRMVIPNRYVETRTLIAERGLQMAPFAPSYGGVGLDPMLVVVFSAVLLLILGISAFVVMKRRRK